MTIGQQVQTRRRYPRNKKKREMLSHIIAAVKNLYEVLDSSATDEVLRAILPEDIIDEAPSSFTTVGHIAHMNLKDDYLPYKHLIGQVIMDKNPNLRTVVNKMDSIDTTFRFFKMELLAGEDDMIAEVVSICAGFLSAHTHTRQPGLSPMI